MSVARYPVVVFDLDGTPLRNTSWMTYPAQRMGRGTAIVEPE